MYLDGPMFKLTKAAPQDRIVESSKDCSDVFGCSNVNCNIAGKHNLTDHQLVQP